MKQPADKPILEYFVTRSDGRRAQWGFRFLSASGRLVMESPGRFSSRARAEQEFVSMMKAIATNQYDVLWQIGVNETAAPEGGDASWIVPLRRRSLSRPLRRPRAPQ